MDIVDDRDIGTFHRIGDRDCSTDARITPSNNCYFALKFTSRAVVGHVAIWLRIHICLTGRICKCLSGDIFGGGTKFGGHNS